MTTKATTKEALEPSTVDAMWEALKAACCKNPAEAKLAVFVSEKKFKDALAPFAAPIVAPEVDHVPIDMILFCPQCGTQHIDKEETEAEYEDRLGRMLEVVIRIDGKPPRWTNPPHKSHLCHQCGAVWRPADIATNGVAQIATRGKRDNIWTRSAAHAASTLNDIAAASIRARATTEQTCEWLRAGDGAAPAPAALRDEAEPRSCVKCGHFDETDPRGRCISVYYDAGGSLCYCGCKCEFAPATTPPSTLAKAAEEIVDWLGTIFPATSSGPYSKEGRRLKIESILQRYAATSPNAPQDGSSGNKARRRRYVRHARSR